MKILVINGPNLNFLGIRERSVYGNQDYEYLKNMIADKGKEIGADIEVFQSNYEGGIIDRIQSSYFDGTEAIVINPGAYTHYSYAIRDALASIVVPKVEIHISDITKREAFRQVSVPKKCVIIRFMAEVYRDIWMQLIIVWHKLKKTVEKV